MLLRNYSLTSCCRRFALTLFSAGLVLSLAAGSAHAAAKKELVHLNTANQQQLEAVKGVGAATAKKITENRPYKSLDELTKAGLSAKKIEALKSYLMVGKTPAAPAPPAAPAKKPEAAPAKAAEKKAPAKAEAARRAIRGIEGRDIEDVSEYSDLKSEKYAKMVEWIRRELGATTLKYQTLEDMIQAIGLPREKLCLYCWTGE